jgi:hypothetical protein
VQPDFSIPEREDHGLLHQPWNEVSDVADVGTPRE